ncbi:MAG: Multidrug resistance protein [Phenylobacterium sp.]|nr:Multidrug resistance protein [Phenylobacterium sp.]
MRSKPLTLVAVCLLACLAAGLSGCGRKPAAAPPPPDVGVVVVQSQPVTLETELPGRTSPVTTSDVRPQVNGIILKRLFQEGATVRAGQVLYEIDPRTYQAAVDQARGQLANAEANATTTRLKAARYGELIKINAISRQDYDDASAAAQQAQANVTQMRAALRAAQINLDYTRVTAPIAGRIGRSNFTPGALVTGSQTGALTTIQQLDPIYVDLSQSSAALLRLERGLAHGQLRNPGAAQAPVRLVLEDGSAYPLEGRLQFTDVTVDQTSGTVNLRAVFPNPNRVLLPGMYVRAHIAEGVAPDGILVPQQAVTHDPKGGGTAFVVDAQGKTQLRNLTLVRAVGDSWLVAAGLTPGDRLIVDGLQRVQPGAPVHAVPYKAPAARAGGAPAAAGGYGS